MPMYQYECEKCKHKDEMFLGIEETKKVFECPKCGKVFKRVPNWEGGIGLTKGTHGYDYDGRTMK